MAWPDLTPKNLLAGNPLQALNPVVKTRAFMHDLRSSWSRSPVVYGLGQLTGKVTPQAAPPKRR